MARERTGQRFDAWLTRATTSGITELDRFARGLTDDRAAVEAGLTLEWSNGQTEGQVNKLKLLKRRCTAERTSTCSGGACSTRPELLGLTDFVGPSGSVGDRPPIVMAPPGLSSRRKCDHGHG